jgi:hypothetical protein
MAVVDRGHLRVDTGRVARQRSIAKGPPRGRPLKSSARVAVDDDATGAVAYLLRPAKSVIAETG